MGIGGLCAEGVSLCAGFMLERSIVDVVISGESVCNPGEVGRGLVGNSWVIAW